MSGSTAPYYRGVKPKQTFSLVGDFTGCERKRLRTSSGELQGNYLYHATL